MKTFVKGIMAGICISLGGWIYIICGYKMSANLNVVGALFFSIGLMLICNFGYYLYTGKICYLFEKSDKYKKKLLELLLGILGNVFGCIIVGFLLRQTLVMKDETLKIFINQLVSNKIERSWYEMIVVSIFCGMFVYFAVECFKKTENQFMRNLFIIIFISSFIVSGFEHCVANMFYFAVGGSYTLNTLFSLLLCIFGNTLGGLFVPFVLKYINKE